MNAIKERILDYLTLEFGRMVDEEQKPCETIVISSKVDFVRPPFKFFKVSQNQRKMYVYGSNNVLIVVDLEHDNKVSKLNLNQKRGVTKRIFCLDESHDTVVEGVSTEDKGFLFVLGSTKRYMTFQSPIVSLDSDSTVPGVRSIREAVTEILVTLKNGCIKLIQIDADKALKEISCSSIREWNKSSKAMDAKFLTHELMLVIRTDESMHILYREKTWVHPLGKLGYKWPYSTHFFINSPFVFNDKYFAFYSSEIIALAALPPNGWRSIVDGNDIKSDQYGMITKISMADHSMAVGYRDGHIDVQNVGFRFDAVYAKPYQNHHLYVNFYEGEGEESDTDKSYIDLQLIVERNENEFPKIIVYVIGSNLRIKKYIRDYSKRCSWDKIMVLREIYGQRYHPRTES